MWPLRGEGRWLRSHPGFQEGEAAELGCGGPRGAGMGRVVACPFPRRWKPEGGLCGAVQTSLLGSAAAAAAAAGTGICERRCRFVFVACWLQAVLCSMWDLHSPAWAPACSGNKES